MKYRLLILTLALFATGAGAEVYGEGEMIKVPYSVPHSKIPPRIPSEVPSKIPTRPTRHLSVIAQEEGYYPANLVVFAGELVQFYLTTTMEAPSCLIIADHEVYMSAVKGRVSEAVAFFGRPGKHKFYCPAGKISGIITVLPSRGSGGDGSGDGYVSAPTGPVSRGRRGRGMVFSPAGGDSNKLDNNELSPVGWTPKDVPVEYGELVEYGESD